MFWLLAMAILAVAAVLLAWPLLARGSSWRPVGLAIVLLLPLGGTLLYRDVGTPAALDASLAEPQAQDFDAMVDSLKSRLSEREEDLEGWLLLGRSLKSLQRYDEALQALETAKRIAPDSPLVTVELAEAKLFASGDPRISEEVRGMLESAVAEDPGLQKGLWLLGIDAAQRGEDQAAVDYWQRLLSQLEPGSPVAQSVREQLALIQGQPGSTPAQNPGEASDWPGISIEISLAPAAVEALPGTLPETAVLFVIVRAGGEAGGPPLGAARIDDPRFPLQVTVDDRNAMLPGRKLSEQTALSIQARVSLSGEPAARAGDWESEISEVSPERSEKVPLVLSRTVQ